MKKTLPLLYIFLLLNKLLFSQQDPQFTQYMYNTMIVNPAYAGYRSNTTIVALARTQWTGIDGAPDTQTLSYNTHLGGSSIGIGSNLVNDVIGPSKETSLDINVSYTIDVNREAKLALGLKLGGRMININWSKGYQIHQNDELFSNTSNTFSPSLGAGVFYYTGEFYAGLSVPNFLRQSRYNGAQKIGNVSLERSHFFFISGYVFNLNNNIKLKPAVLFKGVVGAPVSLDISANFFFNDIFNAGLSWRWGDSISALLGFQINRDFYLGYSYDLTTSNYINYNSGTHEVILRYDLSRDKYRYYF